MIRFRVHIGRSSAIVYGLYLKLLDSPHHILMPLIIAAYDPISSGLPSLYIRSEFEGCFFKTHPLIGGDGRQTLGTVQYKAALCSNTIHTIILHYFNLQYHWFGTIVRNLQSWQFPSPTTLRRNPPLSLHLSPMRMPSWATCNLGTYLIGCLIMIDIVTNSPQRERKPRQAHIVWFLPSGKGHPLGLHIHLRRNEDYCRGQV